VRLRAVYSIKKEDEKKRRAMNWTLTNFLIEMIAGIVGGNAIAVVAKEHSFGALGRTIAGALGGHSAATFCKRSRLWSSIQPAMLICCRIW
jgi:uncharacterized membrane protein YeaQ/YmgE (transglycosylase-associated protein family)